MCARVLLLNGPPGVGKTTVAARLAANHPGAVHIRGDDLRSFAPADASVHLGHGSTQTAAGVLAGAYATMGSPLVIVDYCFLNAEHVARTRAGLPDSTDCSLVTLWAPLEVVEARERARANDPTAGRSPLEYKVSECWHLMNENRASLGHWVETDNVARDDLAHIVAAFAGTACDGLSDHGTTRP